MEKKIIEEDIYTTIKSGTKKKSMFIASDGIQFYGNGAKQRCIDYEKILNYKHIFKYIKNKIIPSILLPDQWYFIENTDQLKSILYVNGFLNEAYKYINGNSFNDENIVLNDWYCIDCEYDEYDNVINIYSLLGVTDHISRLSQKFID